MARATRFTCEDLNGAVDQRYMVMHVGEPIYDIDSREVLGYQAYYVATAVVKTPGEVSKSGAHRRRARSARRRSPHDRRRRAIADFHAACADHADRRPDHRASPTTPTQIGQYQVVVLNRGANDGLEQGAVLAVDQQGAIVDDRIAQASPWQKKAFGDKVHLPYERAGTLIVFKVYDRISYGLVIGARAPMQVADRVYNP